MRQLSQAEKRLEVYESKMTNGLAPDVLSALVKPAARPEPTRSRTSSDNSLDAPVVSSTGEQVGF